MKKFFVLLCVFPFFFASCKKDNQFTLTVACNIPMTGMLSLYGESIQKGIILAQEELKDSLSKYDVKIKYDFMDNASDTNKAVTNCKRHEMTGFDVYVSGITSQIAALIPMLEKAGKPHLIWGSAPVLFTKEDNLFRIRVDYPMEAECFLKYLANNPQFMRVACIYPNVESAQTLFNKLFIPKLPENLSLVFNESYDVTMINFKDLVLKMKKEKPDVIFIKGMNMHIPNIIKDMVAYDMKKPGNMVFTYDLMDAVSQTSPELLEGLIANIPIGEITPSERRIEWNNNFVKKFGSEPNYTNAYAYDLGVILYQVALKKKQGSKKSISELLQETNIDGITGNLRFSPEGLLIGEYVTSIYKQSGFVPLQ